MAVVELNADLCQLEINKNKNGAKKTDYSRNDFAKNEARTKMGSTYLSIEANKHFHNANNFETIANIHENRQNAIGKREYFHSTCT